MHDHGGCCGCGAHSMGRRAFLAAVGGTAAGAAIIGGSSASFAADDAPQFQRATPSLAKKTLTVQPVILYYIPQRAEQTSWRGWGGLHTEEDVTKECGRIQHELKQMCGQAEFSLEMRPLLRVITGEQAAVVRDCDADVVMIYGASGDGGALETMIRPDRHNLLFVRHRTGPAYLWYEIAHPRLLRKTVDEWGQPGLDTADVIVDSYDDVLVRLRALYALKNSVGCKIIAIGGGSGWGAGGENAPQVATDQWKLDIIPVTYEELGPRIAAVKGDAKRIHEAELAAKDYLGLRHTKLETKPEFITRSFLLAQVFEDLMAEHGAQAITVNHCMGTIMGVAETTACLTLSLLNDAGAMAFCESDFVVIPSGILLHHIASMPVFLQDPTYPHHGVVTVAHCTAPRKMDGKRLEPTLLTTHFESDYGVAPKVDMKIGQVITMIDPDFASQRWVGFRGKIVDNPFLDICRSQVDVEIEGDCDQLVENMVGFHWMLAYGDHLRELKYALKKQGVGWMNISPEKSAWA